MSSGLNKDEYLITFKGILHQGESDRGVYDVSVSLFALIISFLAFFQNLSPIWWILPLMAFIISFGAILYWVFNQSNTQYYAEMYEVICGLEKEGVFNKQGQDEGQKEMSFTLATINKEMKKDRRKEKKTNKNK